jgi:hypothetical protein
MPNSPIRQKHALRGLYTVNFKFRRPFRTSSTSVYLRLLHCVEEWLLLLRTVSVVLVAAGEIRNEVALFVLAVFGARGAVRVGIDEVLRNQGEFREDGTVPSADC